MYDIPHSLFVRLPAKARTMILDHFAAVRPDGKYLHMKLQPGTWPATSVSGMNLAIGGFSNEEIARHLDRPLPAVQKDRLIRETRIRIEYGEHRDPKTHKGGWEVNE